MGILLIRIINYGVPSHYGRKCRMGWYKDIIDWFRGKPTTYEIDLQTLVDQVKIKQAKARQYERPKSTC